MRRQVASAFVVLILVACARADSLIRLPAEVKGEVGDFVTIEATTNCKNVRWYPIDGGLAVFPMDLLKDSKTAVVVGKQPGRYRLLAYTAAGDQPSDPQVCVVVIGNPGPKPPDPGPDPPTPNDLFVAVLQSAYASDTDAGKASQLANLAQLYRRFAAAETLKPFGTVGELFEAMKGQAAAVGLSGKLPAIQTAILDKHKGVLSQLPTVRMDDIERGKFEAAFASIAGALEKVKK